jgi:hypothetical protein
MMLPSSFSPVSSPRIVPSSVTAPYPFTRKGPAPFAAAASPRQGNLADPYQGAYPPYGMATTPVPHNDNTFYWSPTMQQFGRGLMTPVFHVTEGAATTIRAFQSNVNNAALITAAALGSVVLLGSMHRERAIASTAGLAATGASVYYGLKTVGEALDQANTSETPQGDWPKHLGAALSYGALGYLGLRQTGKRSVGGMLSRSLERLWDSTINVWENTRKRFNQPPHRWFERH